MPLHHVIGLDGALSRTVESPNTKINPFPFRQNVLLIHCNYILREDGMIAQNPDTQNALERDVQTEM